MEVTVNAFLQDVLHSLRSLRKSPGFTAVVILTLGLGIGFNTAIYSVINAFLLQPLPVNNPDRLVVLATRDHHTDVPHGLSYPDYRDYRTLTAVFSDVLARREFAFAANWKREQRIERIWIDAVTPNYFDLLGVHASRGRTFFPGEARQPVAVLDYTCWKEKFGADSSIVGRTINLDGHVVTLIGVAPEGFQGTQVTMRPDLYIPLQTPGLTGDRMRSAPAASSQDRFEQRDAHELRVIARLQPGVTLAKARAAVDHLAAELALHYPGTNKGVAVITIPERFARPEPEVSGTLPVMAVFSTALVGLVLLIACANIANLLLVRASRRGKEMALRTAEGASRLRIVRLLLTESLILGVLGGSVGVLIAQGAIRILQSRPAAVDLPVHLDWSPDARVLLFSTAVALVTGILCGLMPALEVSRVDLATALKEGTGRSTGPKRRLTYLLVGGQVAVSMVLLIVAGLFIRGAQKAQAVDLGFDWNHLQLFSIDLAKQGYEPTRGREFLRRLSDQIETISGVQSVAVAKYIPFDLQGGDGVFSDEQASTRPSDALSVLSNTVGVGYFRVMGIPVLKGREFDSHDDESGPRVAVINQALAHRLWPGKDALQQRIRLSSGDVLQVIGVVKTGKYGFLTEQPRPYLYLPFRQNYSAPITFHVRTAAAPGPLVSSLRQSVRALNPDLPVYNVKTMEDHLKHGYAFSIVIMGGALSGLFGILGLALASIGLYGVVANTVNQRRREIGIRAALGAGTGNILRLVTRQSLILVSAGAALGAACGIAAGRLLKRVLFSVDPADWTTFLMVATVLCLVSILACLMPARRALKVDPNVALRWE
jgi:predicted permease